MSEIKNMKTFIRMSRGLWGWISVIVGLKLITLVGTARCAQIISGFLGNIASPSLTVADAGSALVFLLLISHRPSTLTDCTAIVRLENGKGTKEIIKS